MCLRDFYSKGIPFNVTARKEVILSAGTVGSTQLLLLSGIGTSTPLIRNNISVIVNNPSVGANLTDHLLLPNVFEISGPNLDGLLRNTTQAAQAMTQWTSTKMGPYANSVANTYGFLRLPSNSTIFTNISDPAAGPNSPHYEMIFTVSRLYYYIVYAVSDGVSVRLVRPWSRYPGHQRLPDNYNSGGQSHFT